MYYYTYLITPWSRVLLEKLTGSAASQEIPRIFGTRKYITVLTSARHIRIIIHIILPVFLYTGFSIKIQNSEKY